MINEAKPLVSVIVPSYNYGHFLQETMDNIALQSYTHWECIVVDDGSSDNTGHVARAQVYKDGRFRYIYQQNAGLSAARNTGLQNSQGSLIQFLDADDKLHPDKLQLQVAHLVAHQEDDIVYGEALYFHTDTPDVLEKERDTKTVEINKLRISGKGEQMVKNFCINNFIPVACPLVRRSVVVRIGEFNTTYRSYEDWHFWFRAAINDISFKYLPEHGTEAYIRIGHTSMMTNQRKLVISGIKLRRFMMRFLSYDLKVYNGLRLAKLRARLILLTLKAGA